MSGYRLAVARFFGSFPLRVVFTVPFIAQIFVVAGIVGWLSFRSGQQAVNDVAGQLRSELAARIQDKLEHYLATPHLVNGINAEAIRLNQLDPGDIPALERYLWHQIQLFDSVSLIALGTEQGDYIEVQRYRDGALNVAVADASTGGNLEIWATDGQGQRTELLNSVPDYDPRTRPWYQAAATHGQPVWTDIYPYVSDQTLAISANQPFYDSQGTLAAVASTDLTLGQIDEFLSSLAVGKTGQTFIMERSGALVASSTAEQPAVAGPGGEPRRLSALESENPLIRQAAEHLLAEFGDLNRISGSRQLDFEIDNRLQFLQVTPFEDARGIDWLIVVVVPQSDFMERINANVRNTLLFSVLALIVAILFGIFTARWVVRPILSLNTAAKKLADGDMDQTINIVRRDEVGGLAHSFNRMAHQLKEAFATLQASEKKYRALFEDSRDAIFISTPSGEIIDMNPAGLTLFGYSRTEMLQKNARNLYINANDRRRFSQQIEEYGEVKDFATKFERKDGSHFDALITATTRRSRQGAGLIYQGIIRDITAQKQAERERLRLTALQRELTLARDIQRNLLPPPQPDWANVELACYSRPAHEMGGDLYAYYRLSDQKFVVAVGDVSGKGMPAALLMSISLASLQSTVQQQLEPLPLLSRLNQTLSSYTHATRQNLALTYVEITPPIPSRETGQLRAVNAGCITPIVRRANGSIEWVDVFGLPLGINSGADFNYVEARLALHKQDLVILISDGVIEALNRQGELFGFERLQAAVETGPAAHSRTMLAHLQAELQAFTTGVSPRDDMTIVVIQV